MGLSTRLQQQPFSWRSSAAAVTQGPALLSPPRAVLSPAGSPAGTPVAQAVLLPPERSARSPRCDATKPQPGYAAFSFKKTPQNSGVCFSETQRLGREHPKSDCPFSEPRCSMPKKRAPGSCPRQDRGAALCTPTSPDPFDGDGPQLPPCPIWRPPGSHFLPYPNFSSLQVSCRGDITAAV